jgi:uncharacterized membrane protein
MFGFTLGIVATFFWSLVNVIDKYLVEKFCKGGSIGSLLILSSFFPVLLVPLSLFLSEHPTDFLYFSLPQIAILIFSGCLTTIWMYFYFSALHDDDVSVVAPLFQLTPVFALILGIFALHEIPTTLQLSCAGLILIGSLILSYEQATGTIKFKLVAYLAIASLIIATMNVIFKYVALDESFWSSILWHSIGTTLAGTTLYVTSREYRDSFKMFVKENLGFGITLNGLNETFVLIGDTIFAYALLLAPVALIQSTQAYQPIFVLLIGIGVAKFKPEWLGEESTDSRIMLQKVVGIVFVVLGSALIYFYT